MKTLALKDGTRISGFVRATQNRPPRECGKCQWYADEHCWHPVVMADPEAPEPTHEHGPRPVNDKDCCDLFQNPSRLVLYALRHGSTDLNDANKFRGWLDVELDADGRADAEHAAQYLADKGIRRIISSDLSRAQETARIVGEALQVEPHTDSRLRPWDLGTFAGKSKSEYQAKLNEYLDHPSRATPQGESLDEFAARFEPALGQYLDEAAEDGGPSLLVFHTSNIVQVENVCLGQKATARPEDTEIVSPGGVLGVWYDGRSYECEPLLGKVTRDGE